MKEELYILYLHYQTKYQDNNEDFIKILKYFESIINNKLHNIHQNDKDDLRQELLMIINDVFRKKTLKMNRNYYFSVVDYQKKYNTNKINWEKYYLEKIKYRNRIGLFLIQKYLKVSFDNRIKDYYKKKGPILLLNRVDKDGIEYLNYIKEVEPKIININAMIIKHIDMFSGKTLIVINNKLKYFRKGHCPNFRYITTSG